MGIDSRLAAPFATASIELWQRRWRAFRHPLNPEKQRLLRARWEALPRELQTPNQLSGRHLTHCGFITGASYCVFHCTHCYLPKNANAVPIPSLPEMLEQIDVSRRLQGPGAGLQITGGDAADAYWRSGHPDELVAIVRHATEIGLVPMLMTHGQTLLQHPEFLEQLIVEGGLRQMAVHIDMTQAGRADIRSTESNQKPIFNRFARLLPTSQKGCARKPGCRLSWRNCNVTARNLDSVAEIVRWFLADRSAQGSGGFSVSSPKRILAAPFSPRTRSPRRLSGVSSVAASGDRSTALPTSAAIRIATRA